ncbi:hypothetical protein QBC40DRAFT_73735 [Triangularia verruculosa]|uniref:Uncharacterized protein n=1 Tax=Triangularia verruculosa TaxID=2587418 RepID=A0AAN7AUS4_9PEZI|nr:hypothetical protein QBC40DRAFT_73735 [Triangularia verruculosa]
MDGSYGNVFPTNRSMSPAVGSSAQANDMYKVNVSRQKTRKWANFKPQNYDGDDWGDEYEDDEPELQQPPPSKPLGPRPPTEAQQFQRSVTMPESTGSLATLPSQSQSHQPRKSSLDATTSPTSPSSLASPSRSPFVRPAEIYRKLEEERKRSLESPRPPLAGVAGPPATNHSQVMVGGEAESGNGRERAGGHPDSRSGLATVPERRSEYGLEGLLDSYGSEEPSNEPANYSSHYTTSESRAPGPLEESKVDAGKNLRRYSTSPQLPLVTRMSGFGDDLFSPSSFLESSQKQTPAPTVGISAISTMAGSTQISDEQPLSTLSPALTPRQHQPERSSTVPTLQGSLSSNHATAMGSSAEEPTPVVGLEQDPNAPSSMTAATQQQPAADLSREPTASKQANEKGIVRPSLPGGWVSETPATPGEGLLPSRIEPIPAVDRVGEDTEVSPSTERTPLNADSSNAPPTDGGASPVKESGLAETPKAHFARPASPPALKTAIPALGTTAEMARGPGSKSSDGMAEKATSNDLATPATTASTTETSEITPTAPLNPRRDPPEITNVHPVLSPPSYGAGSTLEADTSSPLKENDVLSEEILKSLGPVQSTEGFGNTQRETTDAYRAAAQPLGRESSYLGDVYDDYWTASEEKVEAGLLAAAATGQQPEAVKSTEEAARPVVEPPQQGKDPLLDVKPVAVSASSPSSPAKPVASEVGASGTPVAEDTRRRFSWEAGFSDPAPLSIQPTVVEPEPKSEPKSHASPVISGLPAELDATLPSAAPGLKVDAVPSASSLADTVSQASSTLAPRSANATPIEPPSPISVVSDKPNERNLTYTDEKIAVEPPKHEGRASPASGENLAPPPQSVPRASSPRKGSINILPFRQVLEMPTATDRIRNFIDSRAQFAAIDTGLDEWLAIMTSRHPEHINAFVAGFGSQQGLHSPTGAPSQQFGGSGGHGLPANIPMPPPQQHGTSGFSHLHQSAQVQKSKELLMAAGKAGKGLFSKGRNKLRGTGDKVFSSS